MKPFTIPALAMALTLVACNNNDTVEKEETVMTGTGMETAVPVTTTTAIPGSSIGVSAAEVPDTVKTIFMAKYPDAKPEKVTWMRYAADTSDYWPMDMTYYYVMFDYTGESLTAWYNDRGDLVKTSTKVKGDPRLPDAVNRTLNAQYPGYKIEELEKSNDKDMVMYEIKLEKGDAKAKLKVLPNGNIFKRK